MLQTSNSDQPAQTASLMRVVIVGKTISRPSDFYLAKGRHVEQFARMRRSVKVFAVATFQETLIKHLFGWLDGFGLNGPLRQYFSLYRAVSQREGERGEKGQMRVKMSKQLPPAPTASAVGPCPTVIHIVGRPGTGSLPSTIAPPDHPKSNIYLLTKTKRTCRIKMPY